ncbi:MULTISPECIES: DNA topoisomerase IV subunit A [unclassified Brevibacterium]|uniref:DNA gyrase/topoisomerase IV subunit A n=1 Tax=unclassified Brevibacterium TaxID=2614124 RepID=UPI001E32B425|nr:MULTISPECIES: DNA topoisomerase IV subunit A [unclassified Brevibacterium]MCD1284416.1 DNA topoisomerase IV [Brevibacterium sp. CCUG 69071]MDK8435970.1 DNA topoisomerase IV subunit A [Brevibacterium sp. H-BE7]
MPEGRVIDVDVSSEMESSYLEYAYSVIYSRALPDARDGLKPVQRRIVYQMGDMGLRPDRGHVKSSRIVGDVMGKLHPHGDSAIYDALVRLSQDFIMRVPLVDGHGNFGSLDDGPAAPRYTEARLTTASMQMIAGLDEDVVDFIGNYDNTLTQPEVLPSAFPNLLINGASGIAVGMATNMAPHNPGEVIAACAHLIRNPEAGLAELMRFIPGPDLPTGGRIIGLDGVREAYETGRGTFRTRATVSIENINARRKGIVVTELPYLVGPEKVVSKVKDAVGAKKLTGIASIDDYSDRKNGMRLVIGVKNGFNPEAVLAELYRQTPLEESFGINNVCLVKGQPRTLGLRELLTVYLSHRIDVVRRRTVFQLRKAKDRLHLVEGLLIAILDIDEVIQLIRSSDDAATARTRLMDVFELSEVQATYILDLQLRRLTKFSRLELEAERDELRKRIEYLESLLADEAKLRELVAAELEATAEIIGTPRRTVLIEGSMKELSAKGKKAQTDLKIADSPCRVLLSTSGRVARTSDASVQQRGGKRASHDALRSEIVTTTQGKVGAVTSTGRVHMVDVVDLPALPPAAVRPNVAGGVKIAEYAALEKNEKILGLIDLDREFVLGTAGGVVKRVSVSARPNKNEWEAITLKGKDSVVGLAQPEDIDDSLAVFVTSTAQLLAFDASGLRAQGWNASGVAGIKLSAEATAIFFGMTPKAAKTDEDGDADAELGNFAVVTIASGENFYGAPSSSIKVSDFSEFPTKGRATSGVRAHKFLKGETELSLAWVGDSPQAAAAAGGARSLPTEMSRRDGSGSPLESKIDVIGTLPRLGGAKSEQFAEAAESDGESAEADGSAEGSPGNGSARKGARASASKPRQSGGSTQGLATSFDELELGLDDSQDLQEAKDEIARAKFDTDDAVIVSRDDDDEDDDSALF